MTSRRWQKGLDAQEDEMERGPLETAIRAELDELGFDQDKPGPLTTNGLQAILMAETYDRTSAARDLAALDMRIAARMDACRTLGKPVKLSVVDQAAGPGGPGGRQSGRRPGTSGPRRAAG